MIQLIDSSPAGLDGFPVEEAVIVYYGCMMMLFAKWGSSGEYWFFHTHPDGQWVSNHPATEDEIAAVKKVLPT